MSHASARRDPTVSGRYGKHWAGEVGGPNRPAPTTHEQERPMGERTTGDGMADDDALLGQGGPPMNDKQRDTLHRFLERNPHPPWMTDDRYFRRDGFEREYDG